MISGFGTPAGCALASHMDVRCLSFTGSSLTGQKIQMAAASSNMKHLQLELGGKSPALILHDADLQAAAEQTAASMTFMSGQSCIANSRLYVDQSVGEEFISLFKKAFTSSRIGSPLEMNTSHGPQIDAAQRDRIESYIEIGRRDGLLLAGGNVGPGLFVQPTIFENIPESSPLMQEEVFGPVVVINHFKCETEAIERANKSEFGLYASVFTRNIDRALRVAKQLEAGTVAINCTSPTVATDMPLGGCKRSGIGREGYINSLENFLETKTLLIHANI
ncbi:uncharacterized protein LDX57_000256 [Aspergillus melleus]|uniref:uncharacterized protein n=1 Tax=Aspergillus melleus TaxID=138277 RepID=UPI001E8CFA19|nr:uncharacterized protein LDX57_000256 [Aspergillus melleus]KAH8422502.1 hypothetical protein LDX57_000256 [Aspergillus melleus]